ncbi:hypothetical protein LZ32DRAFT_287480 [Colletotrichum eremochloae]|nr:hypothetical protein LZ32DRAFT_287480 [Colletotrichum eremochloae]
MIAVLVTFAVATNVSSDDDKKHEEKRGCQVDGDCDLVRFCFFSSCKHKVPLLSKTSWAGWKGIKISCRKTFGRWATRSIPTYLPSLVDSNRYRSPQSVSPEKRFPNASHRTNC